MKKWWNGTSEEVKEHIEMTATEINRRIDEWHAKKKIEDEKFMKIMGYRYEKMKTGLIKRLLRKFGNRQ